jgi:hypothetical protein
MLLFLAMYPLCSQLRAVALVVHDFISFGRIAAVNKNKTC